MRHAYSVQIAGKQKSGSGDGILPAGSRNKARGQGVRGSKTPEAENECDCRSSH